MIQTKLALATTNDDDAGASYEMSIQIPVREVADALADRSTIDTRRVTQSFGQAN